MKLKFCYECGKSLEGLDSPKFCPGCGTQLIKNNDDKKDQTKDVRNSPVKENASRDTDRVADRVAKENTKKDITGNVNEVEKKVEKSAKKDTKSNEKKIDDNSRKHSGNNQNHNGNRNNFKNNSKSNDDSRKKVENKDYKKEFKKDDFDDKKLNKKDSNKNHHAKSKTRQNVSDKNKSNKKNEVINNKNSNNRDKNEPNKDNRNKRKENNNQNKVNRQNKSFETINKPADKSNNKASQQSSKPKNKPKKKLSYNERQEIKRKERLKDLEEDLLTVEVDDGDSEDLFADSLVVETIEDKVEENKVEEKPKKAIKDVDSLFGDIFEDDNEDLKQDYKEDEKKDEKEESVNNHDQALDEMDAKSFETSANEMIAEAAKDELANVSIEEALKKAESQDKSFGRRSSRRRRVAKEYSDVNNVQPQESSEPQELKESVQHKTTRRRRSPVAGVKKEPEKDTIPPVEKERESLVNKSNINYEMDDGEDDIVVINNQNINIKKGVDGDVEVQDILEGSSVKPKDILRELNKGQSKVRRSAGDESSTTQDKVVAEARRRSSEYTTSNPLNLSGFYGGGNILANLERVPIEEGQDPYYADILTIDHDEPKKMSFEWRNILMITLIIIVILVGLWSMANRLF